MNYRQYDVGAEIDKRRIGLHQWLLFVLCAAVILLDGFDIQTVSYTAPLLAKHLGVSVASFGPIFAAGLAGLTVGSVLIGPIADRFGRKRLLQLSALIFGVFTVATVFADTEFALVINRLFAGIGLGGCIPNALALVAEYTPQRVRTQTVAVVVSATPLGAVLGGLVASSLVPRFGWQSVFLVGGILPIALSVVLGLLPESIRFLVAAGREAQEIVKILKRMAPDFDYEKGGKFVHPQGSQKTGSVGLLFRNGGAQRTLLLWLTYFMVFLVSFLISSWLPSILKQSGVPLTRAVTALIMFQVGGVIGSAVIGHLGDRYGMYRILTAACLLCAASIAALGYMTGIYNGILAVIFVVGFGVQGTISTLYGLASSLYPTAIRVTGIGWAAATGRFGAVFGPLVGGAMMQAHWSMEQMFVAASVPALICAAALLRLGRLNRGVSVSPTLYAAD